MTDDILIRRTGRAGHITLNRAGALNALTWEMVHAIDTALRDWAVDDSVALLIIDAAGERAFCAGGDIADLYAAGRAGDLETPRRFWRDEYRMNARLYRFPKPVVTFLQGFTMGGGVGVGCHGSHRIVCAGSQIAMPECGIGLVPDVGGSALLAQAPGRLGDYLAVTGDRMDAGDAIYAGFADYLVPQADWPALKDKLAATGDVAAVDAAAHPAPESRLAAWQSTIDAQFVGDTLGDVLRGWPATLPAPLAHAQKLMDRNAPLGMACALAIVRRVRMRPTIENALDQEYRFTYRCVEQGDFLEGIRAAIIDKDRNPRWQHASWRDVTQAEVVRMTQPLGPDALTLEDNT